MEDWLAVFDRVRVHILARYCRDQVLRQPLDGLNGRWSFTSGLPDTFMREAGSNAICLGLSATGRNGAVLVWCALSGAVSFYSIDTFPPELWSTCP